MTERSNDGETRCVLARSDRYPGCDDLHFTGYVEDPMGENENPHDTRTGVADVFALEKAQHSDFEPWSKNPVADLAVMLRVHVYV